LSKHETKTAASRWGRRLAVCLAIATLAPNAQAETPIPEDLIAANLLTLPEPCRISREEAGVAPHENVWFDAVAPGVWIASAQCEHHAYQATDVAFRVERRGGALTATLLAFPVWRNLEGTPDAHIAYQPWLVGLIGPVENGRIVLLYRGRGVGDCGELATYDVTGPVVRIVAYRAKADCDGVWVEPDSWPPVPELTLNTYRAAETDARAAALLATVMRRWPRAEWMAHGLVRTDLTGDGREEQWIGGYSRDWNTDATTYHVVMMEAGAVRSWDLPVGTDSQLALCLPAAALVLEDGGKTIAIEDWRCDRMRLTWDAQGKRR
jgi:hypothetical protein